MGIKHEKDQERTIGGWEASRSPTPFSAPAYILSPIDDLDIRTSPPGAHLTEQPVVEGVC